MCQYPTKELLKRRLCTTSVFEFLMSVLTQSRNNDMDWEASVLRKYGFPAIHVWFSGAQIKPFPFQEYNRSYNYLPVWIHCQLKKDEVLPFSEDTQKVCKFCANKQLISTVVLWYHYLSGQFQARVIRARQKTHTQIFLPNISNVIWLNNGNK